MRNQPASAIENDGPEIGPASATRFRLLLTLFCAGALSVLARAGWIQMRLQTRYLNALEVTTTEYEILPARDGRILAGGVVLAADEDLYSLEVHYRWLENPPAESWLRRHVRSALTRQERQDDQLVRRMRRERQQQHEKLWQELEAVTSTSAEELEQRRQSIQQAVGRVADDVNRRYQARWQADDPSPDAEAGLLMRLAERIRDAVTTPPRRIHEERLVVREEEDYHVILTDLPMEIAAAIQAQPQRFPGTRVRVATQRRYLQQRLASHVVGARTPLREQEREGLHDRLSFAPGDWIPRRGRSGVEFSWDHRLRGTPGLRKIVRNRRQQIVESSIVHTPVSGEDVPLTLDPRLQARAESLLAAALRGIRLNDEDPQPTPTAGCALVMDVQDGQLLAAASAPDFDLSLFSAGTQDDWDRLNSDPRQPFLSRITSAELPPGSVFKPVIAAAALEERLQTPDAPFYCQGYLQQPNRHRCLIFRRNGVGHDDITLHRALAQSCNVYFFDIARRGGTQPLSTWSRRFGFGHLTGVDLPFERSGAVPRTSASDSSQGQETSQREALGLAIGQGQLTATPLQIVRMMAAIANGGWLVVPHVATLQGVAQRAGAADVTPRDLTRRRIRRLHKETLNAIREGLTAAVQQPFGTGYGTVRLENVSVAGKSGTAETPGDRPDHAWFAGYVPADDPHFAFVVVLEHGGSGSRAAGPVARELVRAVMQQSL